MALTPRQASQALWPATTSTLPHMALLTLVRAVFSVDKILSGDLSWKHFFFLRYISSAGRVQRLAIIHNGF